MQQKGKEPNEKLIALLQFLSRNIERFFLYLSKTIQLWLQYGILKIMSRSLCKWGESKPQFLNDVSVLIVSNIHNQQQSIKID